MAFFAAAAWLRVPLVRQQWDCAADEGCRVCNIRLPPFVPEHICRRRDAGGLRALLDESREISRIKRRSARTWPSEPGCRSASPECDPHEAGSCVQLLVQPRALSTGLRQPVWPRAGVLNSSSRTSPLQPLKLGDGLCLSNGNFSRY